MSLSIEQFRGLSQSEKERRYWELSEHDKFIARMEDWGYDGKRAVSDEDFLANPPKGLEFLTKEMLKEMFGKDSSKGKQDG